MIGWWLKVWKFGFGCSDVFEQVKANKSHPEKLQIRKVILDELVSALGRQLHRTPGVCPRDGLIKVEGDASDLTTTLGCPDCECNHMRVGLAK
jgi:hypothetical protein